LCFIEFSKGFQLKVIKAIPLIESTYSVGRRISKALFRMIPQLSKRKRGFFLLEGALFHPI